MKSVHVKNELSSYLDNQLSQKDRQSVQEHLSQCKECAQELARLKIVSEKLKGFPAPALNERFDQVVRDTIVRWELDRGQEKMKKKTMFVLIPSGALAGILVIMFFNTMLQGNFRNAGHIEKKMRAEGESVLAGRVAEYRGIGDRQISNGLQKTVNAAGALNSFSAQDSNSSLSGSLVEQKISLITDQARAVQEIAARAQGAAAMAREVYYPDGPVILIQPVLPATADGEKVIRTGYLNLEVASGQETYKQTASLCKELGGYLAASRFFKDATGRESGTITLRIPKDKFNQAIDRLSALGKVESINTDSRDVGQEYANLKAQLDAQMVVYNKMLEALQKKQATIPEAMRLESELTPVLRKIADLKNRIEYLNNAISMATINVSFFESTVSVKALKDSGRYIKESLLASAINAVKFIAGALPTFIVLVFFAGVVLVLVVLVKVWLTSIFKGK